MLFALVWLAIGDGADGELVDARVDVVNEALYVMHELLERGASLGERRGCPQASLPPMRRALLDADTAVRRDGHLRAIPLVLDAMRRLGAAYDAAVQCAYGVESTVELEVDESLDAFNAYYGDASLLFDDTNTLAPKDDITDGRAPTEPIAPLVAPRDVIR